MSLIVAMLLCLAVLLVSAAGFAFYALATPSAGEREEEDAW